MALERHVSPKEFIVRTLLLASTTAVCLRDAATSTTTGITSTLITLLLSPWLLRILSRDSSWPFDLAVLLALDLYSTGLPVLLRPDFLKWFSDTQAPYTNVYGILLLITIFSTAIVIRGDDNQVDSTDSPERKIEVVLPPLLIPARTSHSYFYVGIPVGWRGCAGGALSADGSIAHRHGWFHVEAEDYLERGKGHLGLEGKLRRYLLTQVYHVNSEYTKKKAHIIKGITDDSWSFAYLVTAPRFLGYSFNPVSFWYLYNRDKQLCMMVLEVNNTFDERRMPSCSSHPATMPNS
jgi:hypothetical protein